GFDPRHVGQCNKPTISVGRRLYAAGEACTHALLRARAFDNACAGVTQHCRERRVAWTNDGKRGGNGRAQMTARGDADRRAGFATVRCAGERFEKLVAAETYTASRGEKDADYPHVIRERRGRERSRAVARSSGY